MYVILKIKILLFNIINEHNIFNIIYTNNCNNTINNKLYKKKG